MKKCESKIKTCGDCRVMSHLTFTFKLRSLQIQLKFMYIIEEVNKDIMHSNNCLNPMLKLPEFPLPVFSCKFFTILKNVSLIGKIKKK